MPLTIYRRGGVYHYRGTIGPRGKRRKVRGSCRTADKDIAARQIAEIEADHWKGHFDGPGAILTFRQAVTLYKAAGKSTKLLPKIEAYLKDTLVKDINKGTLQMMAHELFPGCSGASKNRMALTPAAAVINHAAESGLCPPIKVKQFVTESKVKEPATLEWVKAFQAHAAPQMGACALFMYFTGARPGEAIGLQWDDVDLKAGTALIRESKVSKERISNLPPMLIVALANLPRIEDRGVFIYQNPHDMQRAWDATCGLAKIKRLTPHSCRHGFATGLLRRGVDVVTVAWLGGWKSAAMVLKTYGHANKNPKLNELLADTPATQKQLQYSGSAVKSGTS